MKLKAAGVSVRGKFKLVELFNQQWIREQLKGKVKFNDKEIKEVVTQTGLGIFITDNLRIIATPNKITIDTDSEKIIKYVPVIFNSYWKASSKISTLERLNFNFLWSTGKVRKVKISVEGIDINSLLGNKIEYGAVLYVRESDYRMRLLVEKNVDKGYTINFNYLHQMPKQPKDKTVNAILDSFEAKFKESKGIAKQLEGGAKK